MAPAEKIDLIIVLVVYKKKIKDIPSFDLINSLQSKTDLQIRTIIYDNSPATINSKKDFFGNINYIHNQNNPGLATAYNYALKVATDNNCKWLMLLDHDTKLTNEYFKQVFGLIATNALPEDIVAIMPVVKAGDLTLAPVKKQFVRYYTALNKTGKLTGNVSGINSSTIVRVSFINKLGGFNLNFPLDYLDHWFFDEVNKAAKFVYVIDTIIQHDLSILDFDSINFDRYKSILKAKVLFYKDKSLLYTIRLKLSLLRKLLKYTIKKKDKQFALLTLKYLIESFK